MKTNRIIEDLRKVYVRKHDPNYLLLQHFLVLQKKMKIYSLAPKNCKLQLRLRNNNCSGHEELKNGLPQKRFIVCNIDQNIKQNDQKSILSLQKRSKCTTFTELPQNKKNQKRRSISSLPKKANGDNRQIQMDLSLSRHMNLVNRALEGRPEHRKSLQIYQSLLNKKVVFQKEIRQCCILKKDLLMIFALIFNPQLHFLENKRLSFLSDLVKEAYNEVPHNQNNYKSGRNPLQLFTSTIKLTLTPIQKKLRPLKIQRKVLQANVIQSWTKNENENNMFKSQQIQHHTQINRLRQSLLSQQTLVSNIKNGKHSSIILQKIPLGIQRFSENVSQSIGTIFINEKNNSLQQISQQKQLVIRVASQQFKKYESEILDYGLLIQSKHLDVEMEYSDFVANNTLHHEQDLFKSFIKTLTLDYSKTDFQKYQKLTDSFEQFYQKVRSKDLKLRCVIEKKSCLLTEFAQKMESWIENLTLKKQFINNLRSHIIHQKDHIHQKMQSFAKLLNPSQLSLSSNEILIINQHFKLLSKSLSSLIQSIINSYAFS